jgi:hypothetical protein
VTRQDPRDPRAGARSGSSRSGGRSGGSSPRRGLAASSLWEQDEPKRPTAQPLPSWERVPEPESVQQEPPARQVRHRSRFGWFVHRYGWRVYAIPVLAALTVFAVLQIARPPVAAQPTDTAASGAGAGAGAGAAAGAPVTQTVATTIGGTPTVVTRVQAVTTTVTATPTGTPSPSSSRPADPNTAWAKNLTPGALPPGGQFTAQGKGTWHVIKGTTKQVGKGSNVYTYTVEVEDGLESASEGEEFAKGVDKVLSDPRSWIAGRDVALRRVDTGTPSFRISLTSQKTIRDPGYCGFDIPLEASCYNGAVGRVFINDARWERGAVSYNGDIVAYRVYAINHEVGHAMGHAHEPCAVNGGLAPVMMQQSFSTSNNNLHPLDSNIPADGKVCRVNPYPYPKAQATQAPTATSAVAGTTTAG